VRVPNYSIPGMVEQVRREVFEAELRALDRIDSSTALYLLHEGNVSDAGSEREADSIGCVLSRRRYPRYRQSYLAGCHGMALPTLVSHREKYIKENNGTVGCS
jgi:hypothetical protein